MDKETIDKTWRTYMTQGFVPDFHATSPIEGLSESLQARHLQLKGRSEPVDVWVMRANSLSY